MKLSGKDFEVIVMKAAAQKYPSQTRNTLMSGPVGGNSEDKLYTLFSGRELHGQ